MGMGQKLKTARGPQVLVIVSIYQGAIWGTYIFDPQPYSLLPEFLGLKHFGKTMLVAKKCKKPLRK